MSSWTWVLEWVLTQCNVAETACLVPVQWTQPQTCCTDYSGSVASMLLQVVVINKVTQYKVKVSFRPCIATWYENWSCVYVWLCVCVSDVFRPCCSSSTVTIFVYYCKLHSTSKIKTNKTLKYTGVANKLIWPLWVLDQTKNRCPLTAADETYSSVLCNLTAWKTAPRFPECQHITWGTYRKHIR